MKKKEYFLGLDLGTNSIGWAVTDINYRLLRAKGKDLWGVREFERAESAQKRRSYRCNRRRKQREQVRIGLLKDYFADEIKKVDPNFYTRLDNSKYYPEDKNTNLQSKYAIFNDPNYTDADYYKQYPTIFHLRKELISNTNAPYDVRLVFLAILNMYKHRGHFISTGIGSGLKLSDIEPIYESLVEILHTDYDVNLDTNKLIEVIQVLSSSDISRKNKYENILKLFHISKNEKKSTEFMKCLCGLTVDFVTLFDLEEDDKLLISFSDYSYNDMITEIQTRIGDENYAVIESLKQIYDYAMLSKIMGHSDKELSFIRVENYEKHHKDLMLLKKVYQKYKTIDEYNEMFRSNKDGTYSAYIGSTNSTDSLAIDLKQRRNMKGRKAEDLYKTIKKALKDYQDDKDVIYILNQIDTEQFLPKQLTGANSIIPNQIYVRELVKILRNAEDYLPFLKVKDTSGLTVSERIIQLFSFQIPYYIGPTSKNSKNGWVVRKEEGQILPWNISEKIDIGATSEEFITRLIRTCTYINDEKVMPKSSLKYEKYCVLNEINNIRINGERITPKLKQKLYTDIFQKGKKVSRKNVCTYFVNNGIIDSEEQLTGIDVSINSSLSSFGKMYKVFGEKLKEDKYKNAAEQIIYWSTIYGDSKKMRKEKLMDFVESGILTEKDLTRILGFKFKDWGRFSKKLLELQAYDKLRGQQISLIRAMWDYSLNFMEIINSEQFTFKEKLQEKKELSLKTLSDFEVDDLDEYYFSAPVKRMLWQTILVIREIEQVMGNAPKRIFLEMTRSKDEKGDRGRKHSREKQLLELYKNIHDSDTHHWKEEIKKAEEDGNLRRKKLYLYYMQMGKDMYTGEDIDIDSLFEENKYDIDHIYPKHFVKDDSILNNLVLVNKPANEHLKKDLYPIPQQIYNNKKVRELWDMLHKRKFMNDEKYHRLVCRTPFSEEQMAGFIARQLVETSQGAKGIADLIKQLIPETTIVYSKASNVSEFRGKEFLKSRIANEFHHAHDAYLNIVVGNVYYTKFTRNPMNFIRNEYMSDKKKNHYNLARMFDWDVVRDNEIAWIAKNDINEGTMQTVRTMLAKNTPLITKMCYENKGAFYNITPKSKYQAKIANYVPLKRTDIALRDVKKYGGYTSLTPAYFIFIEYGTEKKRKRVFESVPCYYNNQIKTESDLLRYCHDVLHYDNVRIICSKIKKGTLIKLDGYFLYIAGIDARGTIEFHNATNLCVHKNYLNYIHKIEVSQIKSILNVDINKTKNLALYDLLIEKHTNGIFKNNPKPIGEILIQGRDRFTDLGLKEQVDILYRLLSLSSFNKSTENLDAIGGPKENGRIRISGNMTEKKELYLIKQSVTGIFESKINLLKG